MFISLSQFTAICAGLSFLYLIKRIMSSRSVGKRLPKDLKTMPTEALIACGRALDIPIPSSSDTGDAAIRRSILTNPQFLTQPKIRYLLFSESQDSQLREIQLAQGPDLKARIARLLGCRKFCMETLYDEDQITKLRDPQAPGVPIGKLFTTYDIFLDSEHVTFASPASEDSLIPVPFTSRRPNPRAFHILRRVALQGPILVTKSTFLKLNDERNGEDNFFNRGELVCSEKVGLEELRGQAYRTMRESWDEALEVWMGRKVSGEDEEEWNGSEVPHRQSWSILS